MNNELSTQPNPRRRSTGTGSASHSVPTRSAAGLLAFTLAWGPITPDLARADDLEASVFADFTSSVGGRGASSASPARAREAPVGADGTYARSFHLDLPPGRLEMTPRLVLSYSSGRAQRSGPVGAGWTLGLPSIRQDTSRGMPRLDANGQYLGAALQAPAGRIVRGDGVPRAQAGPSGATGALWVPEREIEPVRYEYLAAGDAWIEHLPSGRKRYYGKASALPEARTTNALGTFAWLLVREEDAHGNRIDYRYHSQATPGRSQAVPIVSSIEWGANPRAGLAHVFRVATRLEPAGQGQIDMLNGRVRLVHRIDEIEVGTADGSQVYWTYDLEFAPSGDSGRDLLTSIIRKAPGEPARTTRFSYSNNDGLRASGRFGTARDPAPSDLWSTYAFHPDNPQVITAQPGEARLNARSPVGRKSGYKFIDYDGDGDVDVLYHPSGMAGQSARIRPRGSMVASGGRWFEVPTTAADLFGLPMTLDIANLADLDRDGDQDAVLFEPDEVRVWNTLDGSTSGSASPSVPGGLLCDLDFVCGQMCNSTEYSSLCGQVDPPPIGTVGRDGIVYPDNLDDLFLGHCRCMVSCLDGTCLARQSQAGPVTGREDAELPDTLTGPEAWIALGQSQPGGTVGRREVALRNWPDGVVERYELAWDGTNSATARPVSVFNIPSADVDADGRADLVLTKYKFYPVIYYVNGQEHELVTFTPRVWQTRGEHFVSDLAGPYRVGEEPHSRFNATLVQALSPGSPDGCSAAIQCLTNHLLSPTSPVSEAQVCFNQFSSCSNSALYPGGIGFNALPLDVNADGLADLVVAEPPSTTAAGRRRCEEGHRVYLNTGDGWDVWANQATSVEPDEGWSGTTTFDPLGILRNRSPYCRGSALHPTLDPEPAILENLPLGAATFADLNSDGRLDVIFAFRDLRYPSLDPVQRIFLNTGTGFAEPSASFAPNLWAPNALPRNFALTSLAWRQGNAAPPIPAMFTEEVGDLGRLTDIDGDGLVDVVHAGACRLTGSTDPDHAEDCATNPVLWGRNRGTMPDLLVRVDQPAGAWEAVRYMPPGPAARGPDARVSSAYVPRHWVVDEIERAAGPSSAHDIETVRMRYRDYRRTLEDREAIGFLEVTADFQNRFQGADLETVRVTRRYLADETSGGLPVAQARRGLLEAVIRESGSWRVEDRTTWSAGALGTNAVSLRRDAEHSLSTSVSSGRRLRTEYDQRDLLGFPMRISEGLGQDPHSFFGGVPMRRTTLGYAHDFGAWILGRVGESRTEGYSELVSGQTVQWATLEHERNTFVGPHLVSSTQVGVTPAACGGSADVQTTYSYYASGQMREQIEGARTIVHTYDPDHLYLSSREAEVTEYWDGARVGTSVLVEGYEYDPRHGALTEFTNLAGHTTRTTRDSLGRPIDLTGPAGARLEHHDYQDEYPPSVTTQVFQGASGSFKRRTYLDGEGQVLGVVEAGGGYARRVSALAYDSFGRAVQSYAEGYAQGLDDLQRAGPFKQVVYDGFDRPVRIVGPAGHSSSYSYETDRTIEISPRGFATEQVFGWQGSLTRVRHFEGAYQASQVVAEQSYRYDGLGYLVFVEDADGNVRRLERDRRGDAHRVTMPHRPGAAAQSVVVCRDRDGLPSSVTTPAGRRVDIARDELGRPFKTVAQHGQQRATTYTSYDAWPDALGQVARISNDAGSLEYHYDAAGRRSSVRYAASGSVLGGLAGLPSVYETQFAYTDQGGLRSRESSAFGGSFGFVDLGRLDFQRDALGRARAVDSDGPDGPARLAEVLRFEPDGKLDQVQLGNGLLADWGYDVARRHLTEIRYEDSGSPWARITYPAVDGHGNIEQERRWGAHYGGHSIEKIHTYDALDRLKTSYLKHPGGVSSETYGYSDAGNVVEAAGEQYHYDDGRNAQAVTRIEHGSKLSEYQYDADGWLEQVTVKDSQTGLHETRDLEFDGTGCMRRVETIRRVHGAVRAHSVTGHICGPDGSRLLRVSKDMLTGAMQRVVRIPELGEVRPDDGVLLQRPTVAGTVIVEEARDLSTGTRVMSQSGYVMEDARGSVVLRTPLWGAQGALDRETEYDPWGNRVAVSALPAPRHGFVGAEPDPTDGYLHFGRRVYDPTMRRWLSPDPLLLTEPEYDLGNGQQLNLYSYAANNPVKRVDLSGTLSLPKNLDEAAEMAGSAVGTVTSFAAGALDGAFNPVPMRPLEGHERAYGAGLMVGSAAGMAFDLVGAPTIGGIGGGIAGGAATCSGGVTCVAAPAGVLAGAAVGAAAGGAVGAHVAANVHKPNFDRGQRLLSSGLNSPNGTPKLSRKLTAEDLGLDPKQLDQLEGTFTIDGEVARVRVDMIEGNLGRAGLGAVRNLMNTAREAGASYLRVEGTLGNEVLARVLSKRYGMETSGGVDWFMVPL